MVTSANLPQHQYQAEMSETLNVPQKESPVPQSDPSKPARPTSGAGARRNPKGRWGSRSNYRQENNVVFDRTDGDYGYSSGSTRKKQPHTEHYKDLKYSRQKQYNSSAESNWRTRQRASNQLPSSQNLKTQRPAPRDARPRRDEGASAEPQLPVSPGSSLNAQAEPFIPKVVEKPYPVETMAKLGKVIKHRPRQYKSNHGQSENGKPMDGAVAASNHTDEAPNPHGSDSGSAGSNADKRSHNYKDRKPNSTSLGYKNESSKNAGGQRRPGSAPTHTRAPPSNKSNPRAGRDQPRVKDTHSQSAGPSSNGKQAAKSGNVTKRNECAKMAEDNRVRNSQYAHLHAFTERKPLNAINIETHRENLIETLVKATYECTICYGTIGQDKAIWSCGKCYHMFHFYCLKKWVSTLLAQNPEHGVWRCPTCQEQYESMPNQYRCFCGKVRDPTWNNYDTPHSCGELCGAKRAEECTHACNELCHPGPCPPCNAYTSKHCNCGRSYQKVKCSQQGNVRCTQKCARKLNCSIHDCQVVCHSGKCQPCDVVVVQVCHCGEDKREVICGSNETEFTHYSCAKICDKSLSCGNHSCTRRCHSGSCPPCRTSPEVVTSCNCGKTPLTDMKNVQRTSCTDEIPSCEQICGKVLSCGTDGKPHYCQSQCHAGDCTCKLTTVVRCRCGGKQAQLSCTEALQYTGSNPYKCERKCSKRRECGNKHKCGEACCILESHPCLRICGKRLTCGTHRCQELCHLGNCPTCYNVSFDELRCHCGIAVLYPPIACGAKPPKCNRMCTREHPCEHDIQHRCHSEDVCSPCVTLTTKLCMGGHELRNNIPCYIKDISCGRNCEQELPCGDHKCLKTCHQGDCGSDKCLQPCPKPRPACGHVCAAECHSGSECPSTNCNQKVLLQCQCGQRKETVLCYMTEKRMTQTALMQKMKQLNCTINLTEMMNSVTKKQLDCDEACAQLERNRRMASALDIFNPELLEELAGPQFSEFLKTMARREPAFISEVEKALSELVASTQQSKHSMRSHVFKPMKHGHRQAVHELAEFYGCGTTSYDDEPQRNVVAMAYKSKCCLPTQTLTSFIQNERHPRAPPPIPINASVDELRMKSQKELQRTYVTPEENKIDYFEMT